MSDDDDPAPDRPPAPAGISWIRRPRQPVDEHFSGGELNACFNALDRHVIGGLAETPALIFDLPAGRVRSYDYGQLLDLAGRFGGVLDAIGVVPGNRVLIHLPALPEALIALLGCARIGAVAAFAPAGLSSDELADRIDADLPTVIVSASSGLAVERARLHDHGGSGAPDHEPAGTTIALKERLDEALRRAEHQPVQCVIVQRPGPVAVTGERRPPAAAMGERDLDWATLMRPGTVPPAGCARMQATDPLYLIHATGAGLPALPIENTAIKDAAKQNAAIPDAPVQGTAIETAAIVGMFTTMTEGYGIGPGDVVLATSGVEPTGDGYVGLAPLLAGATVVLLEAGLPEAPEPASLKNLRDRYGVTVMITAGQATR